MSDTVIQVENISKQYRLGEVGTGTLRHDFNRWWHKVRGKEDPYLKIGETNDRTVKGDSDYVWALRDVSFQVKRGEVLGIIGRNGAGKSTLLKILSRVTTPTTGEIKVKGRIASLLEVGTGFNPELTGRDNIYLNGAILGMRKREIDRKFDEIVAFAEVERYIDTPVKRYSSGMYVRLAFAVAAHLEPEILIVDEVLAVGDAQFQKKCLGKIHDVSMQGRTVLFVSHNMAAVASLCQHAILMENGAIIKESTVNDIIAHYLTAQLQGEGFLEWNPGDLPSSENVRFIRAFVQNDKGETVDRFDLRNPFVLGLEYEVLVPTPDLIIGFDLLNPEAVLVCGSNNVELSSGRMHAPGIYRTTCRFPGHLFNENRYQVRFIAHASDGVLLATDLCLGFEVEDVARHGPKFEKVHGILRPKLEWAIQPA